MYEVIPLWLIQTVSIIGLILGSITDFKTREVPDFLNFSLIAIGIVFGAVASIVSWTIWPVLSSLVGLGAGYLFGAAMFYTRQWGGGDAKMLMGLGALQGLGILTIINGSIPLFATTILSILIAGAFYGLLYAGYLVIKHWANFKKEFKKANREKKQIRRRSIIIIVVVLLILVSFLMPDRTLQTILIAMAFLLFFGAYSLVISRTIEKTCMIKMLSVGELTEGDWIVEDVLINGKKICGPKDLGISEKQIKELHKLNVRKVKVKEGIPFIPGFLLGYIVIIIFGNWLQALILALF